MGKRNRDIMGEDEEEEEEEEEIEEEKNNLLYLCVTSGNCDEAWVFLDLKRLDKEAIEDLNMYNKYPSYLKECVWNYAFVALKSSIYLIGGKVHRSTFTSEQLFDYVSMEDTWEVFLSKKVFVYDTNSKKWYGDDEISPMLSPRNNPISVAANDKIYVFGSTFRCSGHLSLDTWSEFYDLNSNQWAYLPSPPHELFDLARPTSPIVHGDLIYFWVIPLNVVYSFHLKNHAWMKLDFDFPLYHYWNTRVAILDDILLYHCHGTIYGYNLKGKHELMSLYNFSDQDRRNLFDFEPMSTYCLPTYLVLSGDGFLRLIWSDPFKQHHIHCYSFRLSKNKDASLALSLVSDAIFIQDCLEIKCVLDV